MTAPKETDMLQIICGNQYFIKTTLTIIIIVSKIWSNIFLLRLYMAGTVLSILLYLSHFLYVWYFSPSLSLCIYIIYVHAKNLIYYNFSFVSCLALSETFYTHRATWGKFYCCFLVTDED